MQWSSIRNSCFLSYTAQKMKLSIKDFFSKCERIRIFCAVLSRKWNLTRHNEKLKISYTNTVIMVIKTYTHFFISNTLVSNTRMTLAKNSSNTLRLSTCYLKNICILHPCYHPTIMKYSKVSKKGLKKQNVSAFVRLCD